MEKDKAKLNLDNLRTMFSTSNLTRSSSGVETARSALLSPKKPTLQLLDGRRSQQIDIFIKKSQLTPAAFSKALNSLTLCEGITAETVELVAALFQGKQHEQALPSHSPLAIICPLPSHHLVLTLTSYYYSHLLLPYTMQIPLTQTLTRKLTGPP